MTVKCAVQAPSPCLINRIVFVFLLERTMTTPQLREAHTWQKTPSDSILHVPLSAVQKDAAHPRTIVTTRPHLERRTTLMRRMSWASSRNERGRRGASDAGMGDLRCVMSGVVWCLVLLGRSAYCTGEGEEVVGALSGPDAINQIADRVGLRSAREAFSLLPGADEAGTDEKQLAKVFLAHIECLPEPGSRGRQIG